MCMCVCVRVTALSGIFLAVHLANKAIFHQLSPLTLQVTVNYRNVTFTILSPSVPETVSMREMNLRIVAKAGARTCDL